MSLQTLKFTISSSTISTPKSNLSLNPRIIVAPFPPISTTTGGAISIYNTNDFQISNRLYFSSNFVQEDDDKSKRFIGKKADVVTLGNLCVDVVLNVPSLPPPSFQERLAYMERLSASKPDKTFWEAGGNCNMAIAGARIGLRCLTVGHIGSEVYGRFLLDVLHDEGIGMVGMTEVTDIPADGAAYETLLCWVLVDPSHRHGFCSRADFSSDPAFSWIAKLSDKAKMAIEQSKIIFCNGYAFDDLSPNLLISALRYALEVRTTVFFDPGPRGRTLSNGTPEQQRALNEYLRMSDVLLLTSDEAESLTGIRNPVVAGKELIKKGKRTKWVIIKMGSKGSVLITRTSISYAPAFKVNVIDTVGCGDSFVAAIAFGYLYDFPTVNTLTLANAVGAATAMGCGAGRNVAKIEKVIEILKDSDVNDDDLLNLYINGDLGIPQVERLAITTNNGKTGGPPNHVSRQLVVSQLVPKLEAVIQKRKVESSVDVECITQTS